MYKTSYLLYQPNQQKTIITHGWIQVLPLTSLPSFPSIPPLPLPAGLCYCLSAATSSIFVKRTAIELAGLQRLWLATEWSIILAAESMEEGRSPFALRPTHGCSLGHGEERKGLATRIASLSFFVPGHFNIILMRNFKRFHYSLNIGPFWPSDSSRYSLGHEVERRGLVTLEASPCFPCFSQLMLAFCPCESCLLGRERTCPHGKIFPALNMLSILTCWSIDNCLCCTTCSNVLKTYRAFLCFTPLERN